VVGILEMGWGREVLGGLRRSFGSNGSWRRKGFGSSENIGL